MYDIHGNAPALEAVLADARDSGADIVVVGGDVVEGPLHGRVDGRTSRADAGRGRRSFGRVRAYPRPVRPGGGKPATGQRRQCRNAVPGRVRLGLLVTVRTHRRASPQRVRRRSAGNGFAREGIRIRSGSNPKAQSMPRPNTSRWRRSNTGLPTRPEPPGSAMQRSPLRSAVELRALRQAA